MYIFAVYKRSSSSSSSSSSSTQFRKCVTHSIIIIVIISVVIHSVQEVCHTQKHSTQLSPHRPRLIKADNLSRPRPPCFWFVLKALWACHSIMDMYIRALQNVIMIMIIIIIILFVLKALWACYCNMDKFALYKMSPSPSPPPPPPPRPSPSSWTTKFWRKVQRQSTQHRPRVFRSQPTSTVVERFGSVQFKFWA